jgi:hypothetical protein
MSFIRVIGVMRVLGIVELSGLLGLCAYLIRRGS